MITEFSSRPVYWLGADRDLLPVRERDLAPIQFNWSGAALRTALHLALVAAPAARKSRFTKPCRRRRGRAPWAAPTDHILLRVLNAVSSHPQDRHQAR
jgi:hypothetical protein